MLGYGCIYQGGYLFSINDSTSNTQSIAGKVAALKDEPLAEPWSTAPIQTDADSLTDGEANTKRLAKPAKQYLAAQACLDKEEQGFTNWYLPAIYELGRYVHVGVDAHCDSSNSNLYTTLFLQGFGGFAERPYWSSTEFSDKAASYAWYKYFRNGNQDGIVKNANGRVRCIRKFTSSGSGKNSKEGGIL